MDSDFKFMKKTTKKKNSAKTAPQEENVSALSLLSQERKEMIERIIDEEAIRRHARKFLEKLAKEGRL